MALPWRGEQSPVGWAAPGLNQNTGICRFIPDQKSLFIKVSIHNLLLHPTVFTDYFYLWMPGSFPLSFPIYTWSSYLSEIKMVGFPSGHLFLVIAVPSTNSYHQCYAILFSNLPISHSKWIFFYCLTISKFSLLPLFTANLVYHVKP